MKRQSRSFDRMLPPVLLFITLGIAHSDNYYDHVVPVIANHLVYDSVNGELYATVGNSKINPNNTVAEINTTTFTVDGYISVPGNPDVLAVSTDGTHLYVSEDTNSDIARVNLATKEVDQTFSLGTSYLGADFALHSNNIVTLPGDPTTIVLTKDYIEVSPGNEGTYAYTNGVQLPNSIQGISIGSLTYAGYSNTCYGYDNQDTGFDFIELLVDKNGLSMGTDFNSFNGGVIQDFGVNIFGCPGNGYVYTTTGLEVDPVTDSKVLTYDFGSNGLNVASSVVPDPYHNRVYFALNQYYGLPYPAYVDDFDMTSGILIGTYNLPTAASYAFDMHQIGPASLAMLTNNGVEIVTPVSINTIMAEPSSVLNGQSSTILVTLPSPAPKGGATITISTSSPVFSLVPGKPTVTSTTVTVPAGSVHASLPITAQFVRTSTTAKVTATYLAQTVTTTITDLPSKPIAFTLSNSTVSGGYPDYGFITIDGAAPTGGVLVTLNSTSSNATVPATVAIPAGSDYATFTIKTTVPSSPVGVVLTAGLNGVSLQSKLSIDPVGVSQLTVSPSTVSKGQTVTATAKLNVAASAAGVLVSFTSSVPGIALPNQSSVEIPAGMTTAQVQIATAQPLVASSVIITATANMASKSATLTVNP